MNNKLSSLAAGRTAELSLSGFPEAYFSNNEIVPRIPKKSLSFWRFFLGAALVLTVFLSLPQQATLETDLSPDSLLNLVNQDRSRYNLKPLQTNSRLMRAAYAKGEHMLRNSYFAHVSPDGVEPWDFIRDQSFSFAYAGENLAINYTSSYELENDFLQSPSHRENLLSPLFTETGIAVIEGQFDGGPVILTVQIFAAPAQ